LAYLNRAVEFAERIKVIDSAQSIRTIRAELVQHLEQLLDSARA
jgi:thymidylate kinase